MSEDTLQPLKNAEKIIERFGGIRPMASKINVAVTTIQGWKKRDVIPAKRRDDVITAAEQHDIDLSDLLGIQTTKTKPSEEKTPPAPSSTSDQPDKGEEEVILLPKEEKTTMLPKEEKVTLLPPSHPKETEDKPEEEQPTQKTEMPKASKPQETIERVEEIEKTLRNETRTTKITALITAAIVIITMIAVLILLMPSKKDAERLSAIEQNVRDMKNEVIEIKNNGSFFGNLIPTDLEERINNLQKQAGEAQEQVGKALETAEKISKDVLSKDAGTIEQRLTKLEQHASVFAAASPELTSMLDRLHTLNSSLEGKAQLNQSVDELNALINGIYNNVGTIDQALEGSPEQSEGDLNLLIHSSIITATQQSEALSKTFEGVPPEKMKAAAILLGFSQFRSALNRDNTAFADDLTLLSNLVGEDQPELQNAITELAPYAESGVLSPAGLSDEFQTLAGEMVIASLKGENVSIEDKAMAHLNELIQVEKDGEMISGTKTQQEVAKAQKLLDEGNIEEAIEVLQTMEGQPANLTDQFIEEAQKTLVAQKMQKIMAESLNLSAADIESLQTGQITQRNLQNIINSVGKTINNNVPNSIKTLH